MNTKHRYNKILLVLCAVAVCALCIWSTPATAQGPIADFPNFTPLTNVSEGMAVDKVGNIYISTSEDGYITIWKYYPDGEVSFFADIGNGNVTSLAVDAKGDVYVVLGGGTDTGVYQVDKYGNTVMLPGTNQIVFPISLAFDKRGNLYVTEGYSLDPDSESGYGPGGIWRIPKGGEAELWLRDDDLLTGIVGSIPGYPLGANGIACYHGDLYVVNSNKGLIVRIRIDLNGDPGQPEIWKVLEEVSESPLLGSSPVMGARLALDVHGNIYVTMVSRAAVVRINADDMSQETVAAYLFDPEAPLSASLDIPTSIAFGTGKGGRKCLFVTNMGWMNDMIPCPPWPGPPWPGPGLLKIEAEAPGMPLP